MRVRLLLSFVLISLFALSIGCGGNASSTNPAVPAFTNASLTGAYTFASSGTNTSGPFLLQATFSVDGHGSITNGHTFYESPTASLSNNDMSGTYVVSPSGQVSFNLNSVVLGAINFQVVLTSSQHGQLVRFENAATASGALDKQDGTAFGQTSIAGTFAFSIKGTDLAGNVEASVGVFTIDAAGNIVSGLQDTNDNGVIRANGTIQSGPTSVLDLLPTLGRGILEFVSTSEGLQGFGCIVVDANHFKLMGGNGMLIGDAYRVTSTNVPTSMAFTMAGTSANTPFAAAGILKTDGAGNILGSSVRDVNLGGANGTNTGNGTYVVSGNRVSFTWNVLMVGYPSTGGIQLLELDNTAVASGVGFQQDGQFSNATATGSYSVSLSGGDKRGEVDAVAQLSTLGNGNLSGALSLNDAGLLNSNVPFSSTYSADSTGRGPGTLVVPGNSLSVIFYTVDSSRILFMENDNTFVATGMLVQQTAQ